ncbi:phosphoprotein [Cutthroat trout virus]|uniref:Phosphoprotein n=1 Tax=Cutthroat trout virus TaxID=1016879 RepID=F5BB19_9VIRU|nr:phosphoprotein [Cutthroat trout virus]AED98523.1 phosphoprotein [Cutthroat trout virus]
MGKLPLTPLPQLLSMLHTKVAHQIHPGLLSAKYSSQWLTPCQLRSLSLSVYLQKLVSSLSARLLEPMELPSWSTNPMEMQFATAHYPHAQAINWAMHLSARPHSALTMTQFSHPSPSASSPSTSRLAMSLSSRVPSRPQPVDPIIGMFRNSPFRESLTSLMGPPLQTFLCLKSGLWMVTSHRSRTPTVSSGSTTSRLPLVLLAPAPSTTSLVIAKSLQAPQLTAC